MLVNYNLNKLHQYTILCFFLIKMIVFSVNHMNIYVEVVFKILQYPMYEEIVFYVAALGFLLNYWCILYKLFVSRRIFYFVTHHLICKIQINDIQSRYTKSCCNEYHKKITHFCNRNLYLKHVPKDKNIHI